MKQIPVIVESTDPSLWTNAVRFHNDPARTYPARPMGPPGGLCERFRVAWLVFTGECDAFRWHRQ